MRGTVSFKLITLCCLLFIRHTHTNRLAANPFEEVYSIAEWVDLNPRQQKIMLDFRDLVESEAVPIPESGKRPIKVAVVYPALQDSSYWRRNLIAFEKRMNELQIPCETFKFLSKPDETALQIKQFRQALDTDPDYLICTLDSLTDFNLVQKILAKKRPKLILQNITTPLKILGQNQPMLYTGFDHDIGSSILADYIKQNISGGINWVMLMFTDGHVSHHRGGAFASSLSEYQHSRLLEIYLAGGDPTKAEKALEDAVARHPDLDFIFACSTDVALGAIRAINRLGLKSSIKVNGWGGGDNELKAIQNEEMFVTVMRMNDQASIAIAEAIRLDLTGNTELIPTIFSGAFHIVDSQTAKDHLDQLKRKAFIYSAVEYGNDD